MKKRVTLRPSFKNAVFLLGMITFPFIANAQDSWKWEAEAEAASEIVYGKITQATADGNVVSGGAYVEELSVGKDSKVGWVIKGVPTAGMYDLTISYISMQERFLLVKVANRDPIVVDCTETSGGWNGTPSTEIDGEGNEITHPGVATKTISLYIPYAGNNNDLVIKAFDGFSKTEGKNLPFAPNLDKLTITPSNAPLKVTPEEMDPIEFEAENFENLSGSAKLMSDKTETYSGHAGVTLGSTGRVTYKITVPETGTYALYINYTTMQTRWIYVKVNSQPKQYVEFSEKTTSWGDKESDDPEKPTIYRKAVLLYLEKGENTLLLNSYNGVTSEHSDSPNMDRMEIVKVQADMSDPGYEMVACPFDYTDMKAVEISSDQSIGDLKPMYDNDERTSLKLNVKEATFTAKMPYPFMLTGYAIASPGNMANWKVEGSENGEQWMEIGSIGSSIEGTYQKHRVEYDRETPTTYKFFRLVATGDENLEIAEWQLFGSPYVSAERALPEDLFEGDVTDLDASEVGWNAAEEFGEKIQHILDGKLTTKFTADGITKNPSEKSPLWIQYIFNVKYPEGIKAQSYSLTVPWELLERNPKSWKLYGYVDDNWTVLDECTNIEFPTTCSTMVFDIANPVECDGYKLEITANNGSRDNTHLTAWQLFDKKQIKEDLVPPVVGINKVQSDDVTSYVYSIGNKIMITADKKAVYCIYGLSGQKMKEGVVSSSVEETVPAGFYIVTVNGVATKVITR